MKRYPGGPSSMRFEEVEKRLQTIPPINLFGIIHLTKWR
jgi:hypothetical protein